MNAGDLNKKIEIQQKAITKDADGYGIESWSTAYTVWALIEDLKGGRFFAAMAAQKENTTLFTIRSNVGVLDNMRVLYNSDYYYIYWIDKGKHRGDFWTLYATNTELAG